MNPQSRRALDLDGDPHAQRASVLVLVRRCDPGPPASPPTRAMQQKLLRPPGFLRS